jgi:hypothetical protein
MRDSRCHGARVFRFRGIRERYADYPCGPPCDTAYSKHGKREPRNRVEGKNRPLNIIGQIRHCIPKMLASQNSRIESNDRGDNIGPLFRRRTSRLWTPRYEQIVPRQ